jgi:hypothetical protein
MGEDHSNGRNGTDAGNTYNPDISPHGFIHVNVTVRKPNIMTSKGDCESKDNHLVRGNEDGDQQTHTLQNGS